MAQPVPCIRPKTIKRLADERVRITWIDPSDPPTCNNCNIYEMEKAMDNDMSTFARIAGQHSIGIRSVWTPVMELEFDYTSQEGDLLYYNADAGLLLGCFNNNSLLADLSTDITAPVPVPVGTNRIQVRIKLNPTNEVSSIPKDFYYIYIKRALPTVPLVLLDYLPDTINIAVTKPANAKFNWYTQATGGTAIATGRSFSPRITTPNVDTFFYVETTDSVTGCITPERTAAHLNIVAIEKTISILKTQTIYNTYAEPSIITETSDKGYKIICLSPNTNNLNMIDGSCIKIDSNLQQIQTNIIASRQNTFLDKVVKSSDGGYLFWGTEVNPLNEDSFSNVLIKVSDGNFSNGVLRTTWERTEATVNPDQDVRSPVATPDGGYLWINDERLLAVKSDGKGSIKWTAPAAGDIILPASDGNGHLLVGTSLLDSIYLSISRLDSAGNIIFQVRGPGLGIHDLPPDSLVPKIQLVAGLPTSNGGYIYAGNILTNTRLSDFFVFKVNATNHIEWAKMYGGSKTERLVNMIATDDGNYLLAGSSNSTNGDILRYYGGFDFLILEIDDHGSLMGSFNLGDENLNELNLITKTSKKNTYVIVGTSGQSSTNTLEGFGGSLLMYEIILSEKKHP
jgi:hypothetical protein